LRSNLSVAPPRDACFVGARDAVPFTFSNPEKLRSVVLSVQADPGRSTARSKPTDNWLS
jgi:hypothetical protein